MVCAGIVLLTQERKVNIIENICGDLNDTPRWKKGKLKGRKSYAEICNADRGRS